MTAISKGIAVVDFRLPILRICRVSRRSDQRSGQRTGCSLKSAIGFLQMACAAQLPICACRVAQRRAAPRRCAAPNSGGSVGSAGGVSENLSGEAISLRPLISLIRPRACDLRIGERFGDRVHRTEADVDRVELRQPLGLRLLLELVADDAEHLLAPCAFAELIGNELLDAELLAQVAPEVRLRARRR